MIFPTVKYSYGATERTLNYCAVEPKIYYSDVIDDISPLTRKRNLTKIAEYAELTILVYVFKDNDPKTLIENYKGDEGQEDVTVYLDEDDPKAIKARGGNNASFTITFVDLFELNKLLRQYYLMIVLKSTEPIRLKARDLWGDGEGNIFGDKDGNIFWM